MGTYHDYRAGLISFDQTKRQIERDTKKLFYSMLLSYKTLENDRISLENTRQRYVESERSFKNGYITKQDYLQAGVSYHNMKRDLEKEEQSFNQQMDQFAMVLGMPAGSKVILEGDLNPQIIEFDQYKLLEEYGPSNTQYVLADINLNSVEDQILGLQLKTFTPTISLNYGFKPGSKDFDASWFSRDNWYDSGNFNLTLAWDLSGLFPWSKSQLQYRNLQREKAKLEIQKEQITSQLWGQLKKVLDEIESAKNSLALDEEVIEQAQQAYDLTSVSYNNGRADFLTVKESENQLNKAKLSYQYDLYTYTSNIIELEYLLNLPQGWAENY